MTLLRAGVPIHYQAEGTGASVTLLHGVGSNLGSWDGVLAHLGSGFRVLRCDLRGHGGSGKPPAPYALSDYVEDLLALLAHQGVAATQLVGFSFGGLIAQAMAVAHPALVSRLVVISAVAGRTEAERTAVLGRADVLAREGPGATVGAAVERWFTPVFRAAHPEVVARQVERVLANDPVGYPAAYRVFAESDLADQLHRVACPALIATGEHDQGSTPAMARLMHERIAGSQLRILPGLRHGLLAEAPAVVADLLRTFLSSD